MLGEGFDLPQLKIAALHDLKKSLGPMVQFIGRSTRAAAESKIGPASVFVVRDPTLAYSPLQDLLREDADSDLLLRDITERATGAVEDVSAFENSFSGAPEDVPTGLLGPTTARMSVPNGSPTRCATISA
jgi:superfamily II DNA or RNA helicase